jgi:hypothetical protein
MRLEQKLNRLTEDKRSRAFARSKKDCQLDVSRGSRKFALWRGDLVGFTVETKDQPKEKEGSSAVSRLLKGLQANLISFSACSRACWLLEYCL